MKDLIGKTAFITGGASGIGLGMAQAFGAAGLRLVIADIDTDSAATAVASLKEAGVTAMAVALDVTRAASWTTAVAEATAAFGGIDILCNNAGVGQGRMANGDPINLAEMSEDLFRMVYEINVTGVFLGIKAVAPQMIARGQGHIVNTASTAGFIAPPGLAAYASSKFAALGLSEALRGELEPHGVGVSVLCPGGVKSNLVPNSAARRSAMIAAPSEKESALATVRPASGRVMEALPVGERVLKAIREDELYIITHPEYRPLIEERFEAIRCAIGASAEPGHVDPEGLLTRSRSPVYTALVARGPVAV